MPVAVVTHPRPLVWIQRLILRTAGGPLRRIWVLAYASVGLAASLYLTAGRSSTTTYLRNGATRGEFLPGLSDLDLVYVAAFRRHADRIRRRSDRLGRGLPWLRPVLDRPVVLAEAELDAAGRNVFTLGLSGPGRAVYFGRSARLEPMRLTVLPGLDPEPERWRRLRGPERRQTPDRPDLQSLRLAGWLEISNWWRIAMPLCVDPGAPNAAAKCVKLVADTAAVWLRLVHDVRSADRGEALGHALRLAPAQEAAICRTLALRASLTARPIAPVAELLPAVRWFSSQVAELLARAADGAGYREVRLLGGWSGDRPLCDWASLAWPVLAEEWVRPGEGDLLDVSAIAAAARRHRPPVYEILDAGAVVVLPALGAQRTRLRAIKCRAADPALWAVLRGRRIAQFPELSGWSVQDTAARAVAEHRAWLRTGVGPIARAEAIHRESLELELLIGAARAGLLDQSIREGAAELALTLPAVTERLIDRRIATPELGDAVLEAYAERGCRPRPPSDLVRELRRAVERLPAYRDGRGELR